MLSQNDFSVDDTFIYTENTDFVNQYLENLSTGGVALIDVSQVVVIDSDGAVNVASPITIPSNWNYVDQLGVDQMGTFYDVSQGADFAVFYSDTDLMKVNLTSGAISILNASDGIPETDDSGNSTGASLTFEITQVTYAFDSFYLVSYDVYVNSIISHKTVRIFDMNGGGNYASDIFDNYISGNMGNYDRIVFLHSDISNGGSFLSITNDLIVNKFDFSFVDDANPIGTINSIDSWLVSLDNVFASNYNSLGITNLQSAYSVGSGRCLMLGTIGSNQFTVLEANGTVYPSFTYPPYLANSQAVITDIDVYDSSTGVTDFDPSNTHAISLTFQSSNYLSPAPYGISVFDAQGCPWQFFANENSGSCVFNSQGFAGEGLNLNGIAKGIQFDSDGRILVSGGSFETFNQEGSNTVFRIGGFEGGSVLNLGCNDVLAENYDFNATFNDGSCNYSAFNVICYASVNSDSTVTVNWAEGSTEFSDFRIYRESGSVGVFDLVSTVNDGDDLVRSYNDTGVNAFVQEHRYKVVGLLSASDTTSSNTPLANLSLVAERGTIKLNSLPDIDNQIILIWNAPANTPLTSYYIVETDTETVIDTVSANVLSYTVINPSVAGDYYISFDAPNCEEGNPVQGLVENVIYTNKSRGKKKGKNKDLVDGLVRSSADNVVRGCTYIDATNYNPNVTADDGSCIIECVDNFLGCNDYLAVNYNSNVTIDDGSCIYDDCPTDVNGNGVTEIQDVLEVLSQFGYQCDGVQLIASNFSEMNEIQLKSALKTNLKQLNFSQDNIQLYEYVQYSIITLSGQVVAHKYSDNIDISGLASGMYIISTQSEARYFVIQN
tara:strand:+ start:406 stop:2904 length:2499 start_codon:yes stop_codon:yes gene_type:complete